MRGIGRVVQLLSAGLGFFLGYFWVVSRWAHGGDWGAGPEILGLAVRAGGAVSAVYVLLLTGLFWSRIPVPAAHGVRVVVSPAAFSVSWAIGALGMSGALWVLG